MTCATSSRMTVRLCRQPRPRPAPLRPVPSCAACTITTTTKSSQVDECRKHTIDNQVHEAKESNGKIYTTRAFWVDRRHPEYNKEEGDTLIILQLGDESKEGHSRGFNLKRFIDRGGYMHTELWYPGKGETRDGKPCDLRMSRIYERKA